MLCFEIDFYLFKWLPKKLLSRLLNKGKNKEQLISTKHLLDKQWENACILHIYWILNAETSLYIHFTCHWIDNTPIDLANI